jgi:NTE family protein
VGAINAGLVAGNAPEDRMGRLREFWSEPNALWFARSLASPNSRYVQNWLSAIQTRVLGALGHFRPRMPGFPFEDFKSLYDLAPMRASLKRLIDFERLNSSELRLTVATTDVETGEIVLFDTANEKLTVDH